MVDFTWLFVGLVPVVVTGVLFVGAQYIWPWLKTVVPAAGLSFLQAVAKQVVLAVEAQYQDAKGSEKLQIALEKVESYLARYHIKVDADAVRCAIEEAWYAMDIKQRMLGVYDVPPIEFKAGKIE